MEIYLDHAATTNTDKRVFEAMLPYFEEHFGNPSSQHGYGRTANKAVSFAKEQAAKILGAKTGEIYLTSGGTESDNWAIKGIAEAAGKGHIITTQVEHHAVLDCCVYLEKKRGFRVTYLPVNEEGLINTEELEKAIAPDTVLISVMFANNETGVIMPVRNIGGIAKSHGIPFHTDAVQAVGRVPINVAELGIDLLSISAHKLYGPKGIGALYIKDGITPERFMHGGGQEKGLRAGTYNSPGAAGLGAALRIADESAEKDNAHHHALAKRLEDGLLKIAGTRINGANASRLAGYVNASFDGIDSLALMVRLDFEGIAVSTGSACTSGSVKPSYVLRAMGRDENEARAALRFTIGRDNTERQIDSVISLITKFVGELRAITPFAQKNGEKHFA
ncbi:MAG: cysteine desulfurase family protein [Christensenellales bacterium]